MDMQLSGTRKGQLNFVNLIGILVDVAIYFTIILPIYQPMANIAVAALDTTWLLYGATVIFIQAFPLIVLIALTLQLLSYAQPQYQ